MARRVRSLLAALALGVGASVGLVGCGDADVDEPGRGGEVEGDDSYDPDDLDEREENE